ncbi:MAG: type II toxin-antitoxin system YafQ family toxin [Patescibacteria group bacterium]
MHDHKLKGKLSDFRAFSVNRDIRIIYSKRTGGLHLEGIGPHDDYAKKSQKL